MAWRTVLIEGRVGGVVKLVFAEAHQFPALADFWVRQVMAPTRAAVRQAVERGIASAELRAIDPDLLMNALVQPLVATCLHRQVINPHAPCPFMCAEHAAPGSHLDWIFRGLTGNPASQPPRGISIAQTPDPASNSIAHPRKASIRLPIPWPTPLHRVGPANTGERNSSTCPPGAIVDRVSGRPQVQLTLSQLRVLHDVATRTAPKRVPETTLRQRRLPRTASQVDSPATSPNKSPPWMRLMRQR